MKLVIERGELLRALGHVTSVVERRTTIPILSNVLLKASGPVLQLKATDPSVVADPPTDSAFLQSALRGIHTYAAAIVRPSLVLEDVSNLTEGGQPRAVRTIPAHFATMREAQGQDFDVVFGKESATRFAIGSPIAMEGVPIPIDLQKFIERLSGIFGQTGTGKSVLTRLVLFGLIRKCAS